MLGCPLLRLRERYGKIAIFDIKKNNFLPAAYFFTFLVIKTLDPDLGIRIRIRIDIQPKMVDPDLDPESMKPDPRNC